MPVEGYGYQMPIQHLLHKPPFLSDISLNRSAFWVFYLFYYYTCELHNYCSIVKLMKRQVPKTQIALEYIGKGMTAAQAARKLEISESGVYAALRKTKAKDLGCCPTCGYKLRK